MIKVVWIARYRKGMAREEASRHWLSTHGALGAKVPGLERYIQNHAVSALPPGEGAPGFDGYSTACYADIATYEASTRTPEWAAIGADSDNVFDSPYFAGMSAVVDELVLTDGPKGGFKIAFVLRYRPGRAKEDAATYWRDVHGPLIERVPGVTRYVQNHARAALGQEGIDTGVTLCFDGYAELWFADRAAFERAAASPEWRAGGEDAANFTEAAVGMAAVVEEHPIKP